MQAHCPPNHQTMPQSNPGQMKPTKTRSAPPMRARAHPQHAPVVRQLLVLLGGAGEAVLKGGGLAELEVLGLGWGMGGGGGSEV